MVTGELPNVQRLVSYLMSEFDMQWKVGPILSAWL
jgi:hypothetical protein